MNVVAVSNEKGEVTDEALLRAAERVHRQLRPHLREDYVGRMRQVLAGGAEMAVALVGGEQELGARDLALFVGDRDHVHWTPSLRNISFTPRTAWRRRLSFSISAMRT